jgi:hypothetical protein
VRSNAVSAFDQLFVVERRLHVRPQITAVAARADMEVRSNAGALRSNADNR